MKSRLAFLRNHYLFSVVGIIGILSFISRPEAPEQALQRFVEILRNQDAPAFLSLIHPDITADKDVGDQEVEAFLSRYGGPDWKLETFSLDRRLQSEDGRATRFQATLQFTGKGLSSRYPEPARLKMTLLWVYDQDRWWFERALETSCSVNFPGQYPTEEQDEIAMRFQAALSVLDSLGLPGKEDLPLAGIAEAGSAEKYYKELVKLHPQERGAKGVTWNARGVTTFLKGAARSQGGLLERYHGDFKRGPHDRPTSPPWDMFRDYVEGAIKRAKRQEKLGYNDKAEEIYRRIISFGRQILDEPGGLQFLEWGIAFQKRGAEELLLLHKITGKPHQEIDAFLRLASRRLNLLSTALNCLDDMADFKSLKAAVLASRRTGDLNFRPWGINTLVIFSLRGAPAGKDVTEKMGTIVRVANPPMQKIAADALRNLEQNNPGPLASFIERQKDWVLTHQVYGPARAVQ